LDVGVVAYTRETDDQVVLVAINPTGDSVTWRLPDAPGIHGWHVALSTMATDATAVPTAPGSPMVLAPNEAVILDGTR
jgi:hypothetical protein